MNKSWLRNGVLVILLASSSGCWTDMVGFLKPSTGHSLDAELTVGDKTEEVAVTGTSETTTNTAETITQTYNTVEEGIGTTELILFLGMAFMLGWLGMPSARQMWLDSRRLLKRKKE